MVIFCEASGSICVGPRRSPVSGHRAPRSLRRVPALSIRPGALCVGPGALCTLSASRSRSFVSDPGARCAGARRSSPGALCVGPRHSFAVCVGSRVHPHVTHPVRAPNCGRRTPQDPGLPQPMPPIRVPHLGSARATIRSCGPQAQIRVPAIQPGAFLFSRREPQTLLFGGKVGKKLERSENELRTIFLFVYAFRSEDSHVPTFWLQLQ